MFARVAVAGWALRPVLGQPRAGPRGATPLVWFPIPIRSGPFEMLFDFPGESPAEDQLPPTAILRWCLVWGSVSLAQSEEEQLK
jgi:hypothetical protein